MAHAEIIEKDLKFANKHFSGLFSCVQREKA